MEARHNKSNYDSDGERDATAQRTLEGQKIYKNVRIIDGVANTPSFLSITSIKQ